MRAAAANDNSIFVDKCLADNSGVGKFKYHKAARFPRKYLYLSYLL